MSVVAVEIKGFNREGNLTWCSGARILRPLFELCSVGLIVLELMSHTYMHIYIHTCVHAYMRTYVRTYVHTHT